MPSDNLTARMRFDQGRQAFSRQDFGDAADHFKGAVTIDPHFQEAHRYLAETFERLGYSTRAKRAWEGLLRIVNDPKAQSEINDRISSL